MSKLMFDDPQFTKEKRIPIVDDTKIKGFFGEYFWLSNFYLCRTFGFPSSENVYQSYKLDPYQYTKEEYKNLNNYFSECTPREAKIMGNTVKLIHNWDDHRIYAMQTALRGKFSWTDNPNLCKKLINTGSRYLEETNYWKDTFWGYDRNMKKGHNVLGKLLMQRREQLKSEMPEGAIKELQINYNLGITGFVIAEDPAKTLTKKD